MTKKKVTRVLLLRKSECSPFFLTRTPPKDDYNRPCSIHQIQRQEEKDATDGKRTQKAFHEIKPDLIYRVRVGENAILCFRAWIEDLDLPRKGRLLLPTFVALCHYVSLMNGLPPMCMKNGKKELCALLDS